MSERDYYEILRDLPRRREVWEVIADLETFPDWIDSVVRVCRESGYSWAELDHIARYEVVPALWFNWEYFSAGHWPLFEPFHDSDWLAARIVKKVGRPHHALTVKLLGRRMMRPLEEPWREVERRFKSGEGGADGSAEEPAGDSHSGD